MNLYRVTVKKLNSDPAIYHSKWLESSSTKELRKYLLKKLEGSNWKLIGIYFERQATFIKKRRYYE